METPTTPQRGVSVPFAAVGVIVSAVLAFGAGLVIGNESVSNAFMPAFAAEALFPAEQPENVDLVPLWRAWQTIDERYVPTGVNATSSTTTDPTGFDDPQKRIWGMIQGMASSLDDPYTVFLPPSDAEIFQDDISGAFEGVGMEIAIRENTLTVVSPLKGTPAFEAGLESGDKIIEIDGESTKGISIDKAVKRIRGERGTTVAFTVIRDGAPEPLEIDVTRDVINIPTLNNELRNDGVYVIELLNFSAVSSNLFRNALRDFVQSGSNMLILDLRGNPGGFLGAAVDMGSWFLPSGKVIVTEDYGDKRDPIVHRSRGYDIFTDNLKMVILVNRGSASASEILAGALHDYDIAQLVGTRTFGKGSVQELVDITPETALKITVARWLLPDGNAIPHDGLEPDVVVEMSEEDVTEGRDPQLERAAEILKEQ